MAITSPGFFLLRVCEREFVVQCRDADTALLLKTGYGAMVQVAGSDLVPHFRLGRQEGGAGFLFAVSDGPDIPVSNVDGLLFEFDKSLTIALQHQRPELFFVHGAVLSAGGRAAVLSAPSGTGKSTTAWAMIASGFGYLSDELAPIDLTRCSVHPYPHAVCLKSRPPAPFQLPPETLDAGRTLHVPIDALPGSIVCEPVPLGAFFFVQRGPGASADAVSLLSPAAVAAHLMSNALNALAHPAAGLEPATVLAKQVPGYTLNTNNLTRACEAVAQILGRA